MNKLRNKSNGIALIIVLTAAISMALIFIAIQYYSLGEYHHLEHIITDKTLDFLVRAGINIAEDKLQNGRWYGATSVRGTHVVDNFPVEDLKGAKITIYADDYTTGAKVKVGNYMYIMLDHIKVFVEATYKNQTLYGYGKFIMAPEPIMGGTSTNGIDPECKTITPTPVTFKRMIHVRIIRPNDAKNISGFSSLSDVGSRKSLAEHLKASLDEFAKNYARNSSISNKVPQEYGETRDKLSESDLHQMIAKFDASGASSASLNSLKNEFILRNFEKFFMTTKWDISMLNKAGKISKTTVELRNIPKKDMSNNRKRALAIIIGSGHPQEVLEGRDYWASFSNSSNESAAAQYLKKRGYISGPDKSPRELSEELGIIKTGNSYKYQWKCTQLTGKPGLDKDGKNIIEWTTKSTIGGGGDSGAAAFVYFYENPNLWKPNGGNLEYSGSGPKPVYSNYYMKGPDGKELPLSSVLQLFLKYVDETSTYTPDGNGKNDGWWKEYVDPGPPTMAHGSDSCCG